MPVASYPYAPLLERCIEFKLFLSSDEFHEKGSGWMEQIGTDLQLPEHETITSWVVKVDKEGDSVIPKAIMFQNLQVHSGIKSEKKGLYTEVVQFRPPLENGSPASILYSHGREREKQIPAYEVARQRCEKLLHTWQARFGLGKFGPVSLHYWNNLLLLKDPVFGNGEEVALGNILEFFAQSVITEPVLPPWRTKARWHGGRPNTYKTLEINGKDELWATFAFVDENKTVSRSSSEILAELDFGHLTVTNMFEQHLTPDALAYCQYGHVLHPRES